MKTAEAINLMVDVCHKQAVECGWWNDLHTGEDLRKKKNIGELLMLIVSEASEAMEGDRKGLSDTHLPHRSMFEVELADILIRVFDLAGSRNLDLGGAVVEKLLYNKTRNDHKVESRRKAGGKAY